MNATSEPSSTSTTAKPTPEHQPFAGKVALITGASDKGIGGAIAERFARDGAAVGLFSRNEPTRLLKKLKGLNARYGWWSTDVTSSEAARLGEQRGS
jgi:NAD(P)-dependent dehydrogenase (short-subunit alcohol dehydrogenase family)